jgi:hypothetical protein
VPLLGSPAGPAGVAVTDGGPADTVTPDRAYAIPAETAISRTTPTPTAAKRRAEGAGGGEVAGQSGSHRGADNTFAGRVRSA